MTRMRVVTISIAALAAVVAAAVAFAQPRQPAAGERAQVSAVERDIQQTLGLVPTFFREYPPEGLAGAWLEMRALQLNPDTALSGMEKELIGLAVAAQIPCEYCVYFHTRAAEVQGADVREVREAVAVSAQTSKWATMISALSVTREGREQLEEIIEHLERQAEAPEERARPRRAPPARDTLRDIRDTLGAMPPHLERYPRPAVAGAWQSYRAIMLDEDTAMTRKQKELTALAVAAQTSCSYCVRLHTRSAEIHGASEAEIGEALAMAAVTRHWSTVLNGRDIDQHQFRRETDQIMRHLARPAEARDER